MPVKVVHVVRKKSRGQHAWVFSNEVTRTEGNPEPGDTVHVFDRKRLLGSGIYNPHSLIRVRLYSEQNEELDTAFLRRRIEAALQYRKMALPGENDFRLMFSESDRVPGLVIDKYGNHFVVQTYALGLDMRHDLVVAALREVFDVASVIEKNDFRLRDPEGLPRRAAAVIRCVALHFRPPRGNPSCGRNPRPPALPRYPLSGGSGSQTSGGGSPASGSGSFGSPIRSYSRGCSWRSISSEIFPVIHVQFIG